MQTENLEEERVLLKYVRAKNFRSAHDLRLDIGPYMTVLAGPNASGKSNIVDVIRFVVDALYDGIDRTIASRGARAILHRHRGGVARKFVIALGFESSSFAGQHQFTVEIPRNGDASIVDERISGHTNRPVKARFDFSLAKGDFVKPKHTDTSKALKDLRYAPDSFMLSVMGDSPIVAKLLTSSLMEGIGTDGESESISQAIIRMTNFLSDISFYHLFPNVMREPKQLRVSDNLDEDGANLPSVLQKLTKQKGEAYNQLVGALNQVVPDIEDVRVRESGGYHYVQLKHGSLSSNSEGSGWLDISNESDGTVRTLGFFVALYQDPPPALIVIEEPELAVHVGALEVLGDALGEVSNRSQILITTHSSDLLDLFPEGSIRAVASLDGRTKAGSLRANQAAALRGALMTAGEIHRMEGLSIEEAS